MSFGTSSRPRNWYDMSYEEQREWERNERTHQSELADAESREREAREEARRRRREAASAREELSYLSENHSRVCAERDELLGERDSLLTALRDLIHTSESFVTLARVQGQSLRDEAAHVVRNSIAHAKTLLGDAP